VLPDVVLVVDGSFHLRYANQVGKEGFGWDPAEWVGRPIIDLVHPDDLPHVVSSMGTVQGKRAGTPIRSEERRVGKECRRLCRSRWSPYH
jgi:PAS domain S-box-containing protein